MDECLEFITELVKQIKTHERIRIALVSWRTVSQTKHPNGIHGNNDQSNEQLYVAKTMCSRLKERRMHKREQGGGFWKATSNIRSTMRLQIQLWFYLCPFFLFFFSCSSEDVLSFFGLVVFSRTSSSQGWE